MEPLGVIPGVGQHKAASNWKGYFYGFWPTPIWPQRFVKIKLFWRKWIAGVISSPTRCGTTIIYFWPYWLLTPNMTPKESFFGSEMIPLNFWLKIGLVCQISLKYHGPAFLLHRPTFFVSNYKRVETYFSDLAWSMHWARARASMKAFSILMCFWRKHFGRFGKCKSKENLINEINF
jgi:hypothetical protein